MLNFLNTFSLKKKSRARRLEYRRSLPEHPVWYKRWLRTPGATHSLIFAMVFFLGTLLMDMWPLYPFTWRTGQFVNSDVEARTDFKVIDEQKMAKEIQNIRENTPLKFQLNSGMLEEMMKQLERIPASFKAAGKPGEVPKNLRALLKISATEEKKEQSGTDKPAVEPSSSDKTSQSPADSPVFKAWIDLADKDTKQDFKNKLAVVRSNLEELFVTDLAGKAFNSERYKLRDAVFLKGHTMLRRSTVAYLVDTGEKNKIMEGIKTATKSGFSEVILPGLRNFLLTKLAAEPLYTYDETQTRQDMEAAISSLKENPDPRCTRKHIAGEVLVPRTRQNGAGGLSSEQRDLLVKEHKAYLSYIWKHKPWLPVWCLITRVTMITLVTVSLCGYVGTFNKPLIRDNIQGLRLIVLCLFILAVVKLNVAFMEMSPYTSLLGLSIGAIITGIVYERRLAIFVSAMICILALMQVRGDLNMLLSFLAIAAMCVCSIGDVRTRSRIIIISILAGLAAFMIIYLTSIMDGIFWPFALKRGLWGGVSVMLAGLIVQGLMPIVERLFGVATGSTLLEWCDVSKPLLKRLAMQAPGTYNHSLQVGAMCEAAAEKVGGNGLLARVGAYYHDIGKISKPQYFSENQEEGQSKHEKLSPAMSTLVIIGHVKDGIEFAHQYSLPTQLRGMIATHHGTTSARYFYQEAVEEAQKSGEPEPDEDRFRYPGPKPRTREEAILMLADGAETSVRAMDKLTPTNIQTQVHAIVADKLGDGQLDECDLTLCEVHIIEESMIKSLCGMYHGRIAYPSEDKTNKKKEKDHEKQEEAGNDSDISNTE